VSQQSANLLHRIIVGVALEICGALSKWAIDASLLDTLGLEVMQLLDTVE